MTKLKVGERFPEIEATGLAGGISTGGLKGKNAVVYFYPKDNTPGCTKEAKDFRDYKENFDALNTEIIGISMDSMKSHEGFAQRYDLNFNLVSDPDKTICTKCGVVGLTGKTARRTTFLIDRDGVIRNIWERVDVDGHAEDVLTKMKDLNLG